MSGPSDRWLEAVRAVLDALDYAALGRIYCDEGGDAFWQAKRPLVERLGRTWAAAVLERVPAGGGAYAGAGVADLPAMLVEVIDGGREVLAANLRVEECEVINAGLRAAGLADRLQVHGGDVAELVEERTFDHVAAVSLFDDPETWPVVSAVTYCRVHPAELDVGRFTGEREQVRSLASRLWNALQPPAWITTTVEEVVWFLEQAAAVDVEVNADELMIDTAIVGDPIGFLRVGGVE